MSQVQRVTYCKQAEERICGLLFLHPEGLTAVQMAKRFHVHYSTVLDYLRQIKPRERARYPGEVGTYPSLVLRGIVETSKVAKWKPGTCPHPANKDKRSHVGTRGRPMTRFTLSAWARADLERDSK